MGEPGPRAGGIAREHRHVRTALAQRGHERRTDQAGCSGDGHAPADL
jgi:hypothetical protein